MANYLRGKVCALKLAEHITITGKRFVLVQPDNNILYSR